MGNRRGFGRGSILAVLLASVGFLAWISVGHAADNVTSGCSDCHKVKPGPAGGAGPGTIQVRPDRVSPHPAPSRPVPGTPPAPSPGAPRTP